MLRLPGLLPRGVPVARARSPLLSVCVRNGANGRHATGSGGEAWSGVGSRAWLSTRPGVDNADADAAPTPQQDAVTPQAPKTLKERFLYFFSRENTVAGDSYNRCVVGWRGAGSGTGSVFILRQCCCWGSWHPLPKPSCLVVGCATRARCLVILQGCSCLCIVRRVP